MFIDLAHARVVEITWDAASRRLWINTENGCIGRICNVEKYLYREMPATIQKEE